MNQPGAQADGEKIYSMAGKNTQMEGYCVKHNLKRRIVGGNIEHIGIAFRASGHIHCSCKETAAEKKRQYPVKTFGRAVT